MLRSKLMCVLPVFIVALCCSRAISQGDLPASSTMLVEAESFQFHGPWNVGSDSATSGKKFMITGGGSAYTAVNVQVAGTYHVWGRSKDYTANQGTRLFKIAIDKSQLGATLGKHGYNGWRWEKAGDFALTAGQHVLELVGLTHFARCDAVLVTTGDEDPNAASLAALAAYRIQPVRIASTLVSSGSFAPPAVQAGASAVPLAQLAGKDMRVVFSRIADVSGGSHVQYTIDMRDGNSWSALPLPSDGSRMYMLNATRAPIDTFNLWPRWTETNSLKLRFSVNGNEYITSGSADNPFFGGAIDIIVPEDVRQIDPRTVEETCKTSTGAQVIVRWSLSSDSDDARVSITFTAKAAGCYSVAFSPFAEIPDDQVKDAELPPLFQSKRRPDSPRLLPNTVMPHPLALVQTQTPAGSPVDLVIAAEPADLPFDWPNADNAVCGFTQLGVAGGWQPTGFMPILGLKSSVLAASESRTVDFRVAVVPGDWKTGIEYVSDNIDRVSDYRKPYGVSLTSAAFNIIDLIKNDDATGWDAKLKGFWNIESKDTVAQSDPLPIISTAILTHDQDFYEKRALPTIEYTLSRPGAHFAAYVVPDSGYIRPDTIKIVTPSKAYGAAHWQGVYDILNRLNPWMADLVTGNGYDPLQTTNHGAVPDWSELMAVYRLNPSAKLLTHIESEADAFIKKEVATPRVVDIGVDPFYNVSYYPYWWDLPDLYEITHDKKYLDAAEEGAFGTICGQWSEPQIPPGDVSINDDGQLKGTNYVWYKGSERYRLGYPRASNDTPVRKAPGWLMSRVGLGFEQPVTYYSGGAESFHNIFNSAWAPSLLRMYQLTGREIYRTYARDTILSRWGNYGGYYINGYTDLPLDPNYPYKGPDLTSIYYHHIPVHLAFTMDYILTEAGERSAGKIHFPWVKQQGYVWFANRVYDAQPGSVFDDPTASLWLDRKLAHVDSPAINYITARGRDRFWVVLMNEASSPESAAIQLNAQALGLLPNKPFTEYDQSGQKTVGQLGQDATIMVPAKGLVAVSYPAGSRDAYPVLPALTGGRTGAKLSGGWESVSAYRIRSPFGFDSLYVVLTGHPPDGSTATLNVDGGAPQTVKAFPYEFTVPRCPMNKDMRFSLGLSEANAVASQSPLMVLPGTAGAIGTEGVH